MSVLGNRYVLVERIGAGAAGVVWRAHDLKLERDVAVKVLHPSTAVELEQRRRLEREARTLAQLTSEYIVRVFDYVDDGENAFLVMELVDGETLAQAVRGRLPLSFATAAAYVVPVARALAYAHARGVVHRDLNPSNILIERRSGRVLTTDFGLARTVANASSLTANGVLMGTPEYWAPEQALGRVTDVTTDVYALGCIVFLLATGHPPFDGDDRLAIGLRRAHEDAPTLRSRLPAAPPDAAVLVDEMLSRDAGNRPSADHVAALLATHACDGVGRDDLRTIAFAIEPQTIPARTHSEPTTAKIDGRAPGSRTRLLAAFVLSAAATLGALVLVHGPRAPVMHAPNLIALRQHAATHLIETQLPRTRVRIVRTYSTRTPAGYVIRQEPRPGATVHRDVGIRLVVSKGTPFAAVPAAAVGEPPTVARTALVRMGFRPRRRYTPSWRIRKGAVIELRPTTGTRLRRPANVTIVIASGYPRSVVPNVLDSGLAEAQRQLAAKHFRTQIVYHVQPTLTGTVLRQTPAPGAVVYRGTRVRLTVARTMRWVKVLARAGTARFWSDAFTVPPHWRIRYQLEPGLLGTAVAQFSWNNGSFPGDRGFIATATDGIRNYVVDDGAGTYRLAVNPYAGTGWYVEVDALR